MNLREILDTYRRATGDKAAPYLVDDEDAINFLNEAENEAARRARLFVDSTSDLAVYPVTIGDPLVTISNKIISIRRMRLASSSVPLKKRLVREMDELAPGWESSTNTSQPSDVVVDYQTGALFLYPRPKADDTLNMTVIREPESAMEADDDVPETPARYHFSLIEWMKYRTFSDEDSDMYDQKRAETALGRFEKEFGERQGAIDERFEFEHYDDVGER